MRPRKGDSASKVAARNCWTAWRATGWRSGASPQRPCSRWSRPRRWTSQIMPGGLTIVEANHVVHYGRWWNPAVESQATDRAYRIGQTKEVWVYLPILRDPSRRVAPTFDERLDLLMDNKQRLAEDFLRPLPPEGEMRDELFEDLKAEAGLQ